MQAGIALPAVDATITTVYTLRRLESHCYRYLACAASRTRSFERLFLRPFLRPTAFPSPVHVLFVCRGNICRSAYAAAKLQALAGERGSLSVRAASAGLETQDGKAADPAACAAAERRSIELGTHRTRSCTPEIIGAADLVLVMEPWQLRRVRQLAPVASEKAIYLGALDRGHGDGPLIEDPYGGDDACFDACFERIDRALEELLERLAAK